MVKDFVDGLWVLSQILKLPTLSDKILFSQTRYDVTHSAEELLVVILKAKGDLRVSALDITRILAYLADMGHVPS